MQQRECVSCCEGIKEGGEGGLPWWSRGGTEVKMLPRVRVQQEGIPALEKTTLAAVRRNTGRGLRVAAERRQAGKLVLG